MRDRVPRLLPGRLSRLQSRFATWRKKQGAGARIPDALWNSAAEAAGEFGLSRTATALKLNYYGLKKWMKRRHGAEDTYVLSTPFVEIPNPIAGLAKECVIEFENGKGACLRVRLKGADIPDVLALGRSFWKGE